MAWQVQEAKQRFSELVQRAVDEGPQVVTKHGKEVVVVVSAAEYERMKPKKMDFRDFLLSGQGPYFDDLEIERSHDLPREIEL